jgi:hypothetical protein
MDEMDVGFESPGSRFTSRPALAVGIPEERWSAYNDHSEKALRKEVGDWLFDDHDQLGRGEPVSGSAGRGASAWIPVVEWVALHAAGGVVSAAAAMAFKAVWQRAKGGPRQGGAVRRLMVSRGGAAALAVAEIGLRFSDRDRLEIEAVEEPSSISGGGVSELSYVGLEPWVVLLRNREARIRYLVIVGPDGEILGALNTTMNGFEELFLPPAEESEWPRGGG